jgi:archaellum component FlaC
MHRQPGWASPRRFQFEPYHGLTGATEALMRRLLLICVFCPSLALAQAPAAPAKLSGELPVKRVVLYKNGVGYFEHSGKVLGSQELNIQFTNGQLNDVLKSLTVVDLGAGKITGVRYNSIAPLSERLSTLRLRLGEQATRSDVLTAARGSRVEVRSGTSSATGKLLSVESTQRPVGKDEYLDMPQVVLMTDTGEIRTFDLTPATSVRIAETELTQEIGHYLNLIGSSRANDLRRMTISTTGTGNRDIFVSYISEVPVWKSTYRIVLPRDPKNKPLIQGWAIIDNTIGEDWKDVQLSLVAGSPQSFVQQISQPLYVRRPTVDLPKSAMLTPQTHEGTMESTDAFSAKKIVGGVPGGVPGGQMGGVIGGIISPAPYTNGFVNISGQVTDITGAAVRNVRVTVVNKQTGDTRQVQTNATGYYSVMAQPGSNTVKFEAPGFQTTQYNRDFAASRPASLNAKLNVGSVSQTVEIDGASDSAESANAYLAKRSSGISAEAEGKVLGDLFEYALQQKITVLKNQSALVPIVQSPITAERVTLWNSRDEAPLRALWVTNSTGLTLDSGTFNIIEGDAFAGEGLVSELHPSERRLLSYAADTAVRITSDQDSKSQPYTRVSIAKGMMKLTREERSLTTYRVRNSDVQSRDVIIEHPVQDDWELADGVKPEESSSSFHRFRVKVDPTKTVELNVSEFRPEETEYVVSNLTSDQVALFVKDKAITPDLEQNLRRVLDKKNEIGKVDSDMLGRRQEISRISQEQNRLRENMKALKGSAEEKALLQRYVQQLNSQEDRLSVLDREITKLDELRSTLSGQLDEMVQRIAVDEKLDHGVQASASK